MFFLTYQKYTRIEKKQRKIRDDQLKIETKKNEYDTIRKKHAFKIKKNKKNESN